MEKSDDIFDAILREAIGPAAEHDIAKASDILDGFQGMAPPPYSKRHQRFMNGLVIRSRWSPSRLKKTAACFVAVLFAGMLGVTIPVDAYRNTLFDLLFKNNQTNISMDLALKASELAPKDLSIQSLYYPNYLPEGIAINRVYQRESGTIVCEFLGKGCKLEISQRLVKSGVHAVYDNEKDEAELIEIRDTTAVYLRNKEQSSLSFVLEADSGLVTYISIHTKNVPKIELMKIAQNLKKQDEGL